MVDIRFGNRRLCWPSYSIEMSESSRASRGGLRRRADRRRVELAVVSRQHWRDQDFHLGKQDD